MAVNKPKAPAKPAALNASAQPEPKDSGASLKFNTPEIRVGLSAASQPKMPKMPKDKKVIVPKIKVPKPQKAKM